LSETVGIWDLFVLVVFFILTLLVGFYAAAGDQSKALNATTSDPDSNLVFFLGRRNLPWPVLSLSIVATETSTLTFLGVPALSYKGDYSFLSLATGFVIGRILSAFLLLPRYGKGSYLSIYEWIGIEMGKPSQKTLSILFCIVRILSDGVRLYATSLPLSFLLVAFFPDTWNFSKVSILSLLFISVITVVYSAYGGFRAVVWADFFQFLVYTLGGMFVFYILGKEIGFFQDLSKIPETKFDILHTNLKLDSGDWDPYFVLFSIPGGILLSLGSHGTDQMIVQRLLACKNLKESQLALICSGFFVFLQFFLFLAIGTCLYVAIPSFENPNHVFPEYIVNRLSTPWKGLILAGVFASSMSTLSSSLNSLTLTTEVDLGINQSLSRWLTHTTLTVAWGVLLFVSSILPFFLDETARTNIVELGLSFSSLVFGAIISIFLLQIHSSQRTLERMKDDFPWILTGAILTNWGVYSFFNPPFTLLVALGIGNFFTLYAMLLFVRSFLPPVQRKL